MQKPFLGPGSPSVQCGHWESSKVLAGLAFCEMQSQYPQSAFQGFSARSPAGQQQFATQTLCVHLLGLDNCFRLQPKHNYLGNSAGAECNLTGWQ